MSGANGRNGSAITAIVPEVLDVGEGGSARAEGLGLPDDSTPVPPGMVRHGDGGLRRAPKAKAKSKGGRPSKLTPAVQQLVVDALLAGNYLHVAAGYAGVHRDTLDHWLRRGREDREAGKGRSRYGRFSDAVEKAMAEAEVRLVATIAAAAPKDWRAAARILAARHPERWAERGGGTTVNVNPGGSTAPGVSVYLPREDPE